MELPEQIVALLRDEAYTALGREALTGELVEIEREKDTINRTRPPFLMIAGKEFQNAFTESLRALSERESGIREQLARVEAVEARLHPTLRKALAQWLANTGGDYSSFSRLAARLMDWENSFERLPELLIAFARDLRAFRLSLNGGGASSVRDLAILRETAVRLERHQHELTIISAAATEEIPPILAGQVRLPDLPELRRVAWVGRLAEMTLTSASTEAGRTETEIRRFLAEGAEKALAEVQAARDVCRRAQGEFIDHYWGQLRAHAAAHFVEERSLEEVLTMLTKRYVEGELLRESTATSFDPFHGTA